MAYNLIIVDQFPMPRLSSLDSVRSSSSVNEVQSPRAMEKDHSIKSVESKGASVTHSSGGKIP